ncbi:hypothetical protein A8M52_28275 [Escherichia coli]|uniref:Uncharacterized protein n=1 Tax=Escherichia coli O7:K1 (strain IAI39 / ExPEC) TaxID=585057 RepID=A0A0H3MFZ0_ECO7I|nr:hypothetical protein CE10_2311 [Escherichia coli O7:K1 str. CE10]KUV48547.1 hypothetical protein AWE92_13660 [Escherichia coli]CAR17157.1 hypothetical protein ECIAI39_1020 [Escherichia coli IAI39]KZJ99701.1 hypothetical protein AWH01_09025 [Escherichia coli]OWC13790.1 hypothetical protein A8G20_26580 [Escherichia coli]
MRNFDKPEVYRLISDEACAGLIITDTDAHVYQQLNDIV